MRIGGQLDRAKVQLRFLFWGRPVSLGGLTNSGGIDREPTCCVQVHTNKRVVGVSPAPSQKMQVEFDFNGIRTERGSSALTREDI